MMRPERPSRDEHRTRRRETHRRGWFRETAMLGGAFALTPWLVRDGRTDEAASKPGLIIRNRQPLDAESPVEIFDQWRTPNPWFFVRSHFGAPALGLVPWTLEIRGEIQSPRTLTLEDLAGLEQVTFPAVLQCAGNGRGLFVPKIAGVEWELGAVGNAEWSGVRLRDLLERAGLKAGAKHVQLLGSDRPPNPKTPPFFRSIPLEKALDPHTIIATRMNGEPLPRLHGGPARLVVPGWTGNHWMKWLRTLTVSTNEAPGFYQQTGYRIPKNPVPPGETVKPDDLVPVTSMNVKSLIATPSRGALLAEGRQEVVGVAWTGEGRVTRVEVSVDDGDWASATLEGPDHPFAWRLWRFPWLATPGPHTLRVRATDSSNQTQPETSPWNKSGYLWNGIDRVNCEVHRR